MMEREIIPSPYGGRDQKEAWMRLRQRDRIAEIEGVREAQLIAEANAEVQRRRIRRLEHELELHRQLLIEAEKEAQLRRSQTDENLHVSLPRPRLRRRV